jgi:uncharacterized cupin superfamily protein
MLLKSFRPVRFEVEMKEKYIVKKSEIESMDGLFKQHFLNSNAQRVNKSLGDLVGIDGFGFHIIEVPPGRDSTEFHVHYHEDECTYVLAGEGIVTLGEEEFPISEGDFIGYRSGGLPHGMKNTGDKPLKCIVVGERKDHDVGDYPRLKKRIFRNKGLAWNLVDIDSIEEPVAGKK